MQSIYRYQRSILLAVLVLGGAGGIGLAVLLPQDLSYCGGWLLGSAAGLVILRLRVVSILGMAQDEPRRWGRATIRSSALQFGVALAALLTAALTEKIDLYACFCGVMLERLVLIGDSLLRPAALSGPAENETIADGSRS
ncbi:MAG: hypothetical protein A2498_09930 [Lentisphaerae bacterium RIFOXYC12_FULL_60_16]|nr:MAG: hypothetical protein A2498_09930 [Lentisphaerae bacterium RIFOXYC12_FULL_60_16]OGV85063.1 MAG: hypothetical protein A2340_05180 [Lentisphaerae bacterium RIFOXYB12_FULL_60_10]